MRGITTGIVLLGLCGCGGGSGGGAAASDARIGDEAPGADAGPGSAFSGPAINPPLEEAPTLFRLDVRHGPGGVSLAGASLVEGGPGYPAPLPDLYGDLFVVAYAGDAVRAAVPLRFPTEARLEGFAADGAGDVRVVAVGDAEESAFLPYAPDVDRIDVIDPSGHAVVHVGAEALPRPAHVDRAADALRARYPHIEVVTGLDGLPSALRDVIDQVLEPDEAQLRGIADALDRATPIARAAVRRVAIARYAGGGDHSGADGRTFTLLAQTSGGSVTFNVRLFGDFARFREQTVVHEAAHAFTYLYDPPPGGVAPDAWSAQWPPAVRAQADALRDRFQLEDGLVGTFDYLQTSALRERLTDSGYADGGDATMTDAEAVSRGFATGYGQTFAIEDVAELTQSVQVNAGGTLCTRLRAARTIGDHEALLWAKLRMVQGVGLVTDAAVHACVGETQVQAQPGIDLPAVASFDPAQDDQVRIASDFTAFDEPEESTCPSVLHLFTCGRFAPTPDSREFTIYARSPYGGPNAWRGSAPPGFQPGDPLPEYHFLEFALYLPPNRHLVGVHRVTRWGDPVIGQGIHPYAAGYLIDSTSDTPSLGTGAERGLVVFTQADAGRVEGELLFVPLETFPEGELAHTVPVGTFRIEPPNATRDACCGVP